MALFLDIGPEDQLVVGKDAVITVEHKSGRRVRLRIDGTADVAMVRKAPQPDSAPARQVSDGRGT